jgi:hypothetical protein
MCARPIKTHSINGDIFFFARHSMQSITSIANNNKNHQAVNGLTLDIAVNKAEISE